MVWDANQADNIDDEQLHQLAYQWASVKATKMKKVVWPQAAHLTSLLLSDPAHHRPKTWDQVMQHPFLASKSAAMSTKRIVMSCPEFGTINADGCGPYDQNVMEKVSQLQQVGFVKFGFDRAGTSTAREKDGALFDKAFALRDEGKYDEAIELLKATDWWYGYQTSVKQAVKLESQGFDGELNVTCIQGGFITQLEAAEMERIMVEATSDCAKSGIEVRYVITEVSYYEFLMEYEPLSDDQLLGKQQQVQQTSKALDEELDCDTHGGASMTIKPGEAVEVDAHQSDVHTQLVEAREQLAAKDEELQQLRAQLARLEGVPPPRD